MNTETARTALEAEEHRNRRLAENIAAGRSPLDPQIEKTIREIAEANLNVPGPRVIQVLDELERLRRVLLDVHAGIGNALYGAGLKRDGK